MLLTALQKPLRKTRKEHLSSNQVYYMPGFLENCISRIPFSLNISRKDLLATSLGSFLPSFATPPQEKRKPTEKFVLVSDLKSSLTEKKQHPQHRNPTHTDTQCLSLPVAIALLLHMEWIGAFLALTLQISEAAL